jgi:hypothetical protein
MPIVLPRLCVLYFCHFEPLFATAIGLEIDDPVGSLLATCLLFESLKSKHLRAS